MITKTELDELVKRYENPDFIKNDPVQFIHKFKNKKDIEIAGFISSLLSYGSREQFIKKLNILFGDIAQNEPLNFIENFDSGIIGDFNYRFGKPKDFVAIFKIMKELYPKYKDKIDKRYKLRRTRKTGIAFEHEYSDNC